MTTREEYIGALKRAAWLAADGDRNLLSDLADRMRRANEHWQGPDATDQISTWRVIGWEPVLILPLGGDKSSADPE